MSTEAHSVDSGAPAEALKEVLAAHRAIVSGTGHGWAVICSCGYREMGTDANAHIAAALVPLVIAAKAQAWREGAITALDFATRNEDGITLSLDLAAYPNPYDHGTAPAPTGPEEGR